MNVPQILRSLLTAVENGDTPKVQSILDQGYSVEATDADGNSLLHIAAANGHDGVVRLLLVKGATLDRCNLYGWTALMQASRYGHEGVVLHLLNNKADMNVTNTMGVSALTAAVRGGHSKVVEILLENDFSVDCSESSYHFVTSLMVAAQDGRDDLLRTLLRRGVPADQKHSSTGWTALMITAMTGQLPMARLLVDKGSNPNKKNRHGKTALAVATECELREIRGYLDRKTTDKPEKVDDQGINIIAAVKKGDYQKVKEILIKHKDECNATTPDGATPLMYAAITGQTNMIELLVESGADVNAKDYENGWTALMQATYYGKVEAAKCLIALNADVGCRAKNNITAFDMALLINAPTSLFRLLAEHAMHGNPTGQSMDGASEGDTSAADKLMSTTMAWQNTIPWSSTLGEKNKDVVGQVAQKKSVWANFKKTAKINKLTRTLRNAFKNPNKVENFENTLIVSGGGSCDAKGESQHGNSVTIADPYSMTNHSAPKSRLPEEKLAVISPPFQTNMAEQKQGSDSQKKGSNFKSSISLSLSSSGESSVSRSVVKPVKFLHGSGNSGGNNNSPHSSGGASDVTRSFSLADRGKDVYGRSGDRYSDTVISKMAQMKQRKEVSASRATAGRMRTSASAEQLSSVQSQQKSRGHRRKGSRAESVLSSQSTSSTLTPPRSPDTPRSHVSFKNNLRQRYHGDSRSVSSHDSHPRSRKSYRTSNPPSFTEEDELSDILQKLSLENYHPIFEKEEIDMDTFLTMTNGDLNELGIMQETARRRILKAITQLSEGKENYAKIHTSPGFYP